MTCVFLMGLAHVEHIAEELMKDINTYIHSEN